jgi:hypothetical protein
MSTLYRGRKPGGLRNRGAHVMTQLGRVELHKVAEIPASAKEVWALLTDWAGMLRWSQSAERGGGPLGALVGCELVGDRDQIPRTRRMILDSGVAVEEELFYQNDETKRIYYRKNDAFGTVGYIATSCVDEIDDGRCLLHITSWFDSEMETSLAAARFETIYNGIFNGFKMYFLANTSLESATG